MFQKFQITVGGFAAGTTLKKLSLTLQIFFSVYETCVTSTLRNCCVHYAHSLPGAGTQAA